MNIQSALWVLMAWCLSTRASVATVLGMHPCISSCLWVNPVGVELFLRNHEDTISFSNIFQHWDGIGHRKFLSFFVGDKGTFILRVQYHGCWWPECKDPGHQQPGYWINSPGTLWLLDQNTEPVIYSWMITRKIPWLLLPWLHVSPGYQQPCCKLCRRNRPLSSTREDFNYLYQLSFGKS